MAPWTVVVLVMLGCAALASSAAAGLRVGLKRIDSDDNRSSAVSVPDRSRTRPGSAGSWRRWTG